MPFDVESSIPVEDKQGGVVEKPNFDIGSSVSVKADESGMTDYDRFAAGQLDQQVKDALHKPIDESQVQYIQDQEKQDQGAFNSFMVPYAEGVVGFFTKPFGVRPVMGGKPFETAKGPKSASEAERDKQMQEQHPIATTLGQIVGGTAPFIAAAPLFPQSLLGTVATFETVGLTSEFGRQQTEESLMTPLGQRGAMLGQEAIKSGIMAPIWFYSGGLQFIGRPFLSAVTRAGVRGAGQATLSAVFGTDLASALKEGGMITALSLIFESPALAKTALGRGVINNLNNRAASAGIDAKIVGPFDKIDEVAVKSDILTMVKAFYSSLRTKFDGADIQANNARPQAKFLALTGPQPTGGGASGKNTAPLTIVTPGSGQPAAGGLPAKNQIQPAFYSKMASVLAEKMPESASPEQIRGILKGGGVSPDEVEMSNIGDFFRGKDKVSKNDVLDYLQKNKVQLEEIVKSDELTVRRKQEIESAFEKEGLSIGQEMGGDIIVEDKDGELIDPDQLEADYPELSKLSGEYTSLYGEEGGEAVSPVTKFQKYTLPGGKNYREVLVKLPTPGTKGNEERLNELYDLADKRDLTPQESEEITALERALNNQGGQVTESGQVFRSPHWEEPNILVHARLTDHTTTDGKKVLFVEEIQSDWARAGREKGFIKNIPGSREELDKRRLELESFGKNATLEQKQEWADIKNVLENKGIPSQPLLKHWQPLILKRLLRYAAEGGYDYLAWTTGVQQAERYDLSKQVDKVRVFKRESGTYSVGVNKTGESALIIINESAKENELVDLLGKDLAEKIKNQEVGKVITYEGGDLKIGGSWAINLYDKQIPSILKDLTKEDPKIIRMKGASDQKFIQQAIPITPELKSRVLYQGQPILGKTPAEIGKPLEPSKAWKFIFRMSEAVEVVNTKGEKVTLPKGEEYHTMNVRDEKGNVVPGKVRLQDGKQITVFEGELGKLKGYLLPAGETPAAGGLPHKELPDITVEDFNQWQDPLPVEDINVDPELIARLKAAQEILGTPIKRTNGQQPFNSGFRSPEYNKKLQAQGVPAADTSLHMDLDGGGSRAVDIPSKSLKLDQVKLAAALQQSGLDVEDLSLTPNHVHAELPTEGSPTKLMARPSDFGSVPPKEPPPTAISGSPEEGPSDEEMRAGFEAEMRAEIEAQRKELKDYLNGKLKYTLKTKGEYVNLKDLNWLFAKEGERGYTPDELFGELQGMGFQVESEDEFIKLVSDYFKEDVEKKAQITFIRSERAARRNKIKITEQLTNKGHRDMARALRLRNIEAAKLLARIERALSQPMAKAKVKKQIREITGMVKIGDVIREDTALKRMLKREEAAAREGYSAGKKAGAAAQKEHDRAVATNAVVRQAAKEEVDGLVKDLRDIENHLGVMPIEYQDAVKGILEEYDLKKRSDKTIAERESAKKFIQRMEAEGEEVNIPQEQLDLLEKVTLNNMTVDDLRQVHDTVMRLYHLGKLKDKLLTLREERTFEQMKKEALEALKAGKDLKEESLIIKYLREQNRDLKSKTIEQINKYIAIHLRPELMANILDGLKEGPNTKALWYPILDAQISELTEAARTMQKIKEIHAELDMEKIFRKKYDVGRFKGMTKNQAMAIYAHSRNESQYQALLASGITDADLLDIERFLTRAEKSAVEEMWDYYANEQYPALDKVYSELEGTHLGKEDSYFPKDRLEDVGYNKELEKDILERNYIARAGVAKGFTKQRVSNTKGFDEFDYLGTIVRNWRKVEHYKAFAQAVRDVNKYLHDADIRRAIIDTRGEEYYNNLDKWLKDSAYGGNRQILNDIDKFSRWLRTNYVTSVLGFNLMTVLKQPASIFQGIEMEGEGAFLRGLGEFLINPAEATRFINSKSPTMKYRAFSQERELVEIKQRESVIDMLIGPKGSQMIKEKGMAPIVIADLITVRILWIGSYRQSIADGLSENAAIEAADRVIRRTQPMGGTIHLPQVFRGGPTQQIFTTFTNQLNQNFNRVYEEAYKTGKGDEGFFHALRAMLYLLVLPALWIGWVNRKRFPEGLGELASDIAQTSMGGLFITGMIFSSMAAGRPTSGTMFDSFIQDIAGIFLGKKPGTKVDRTIRVLSKISGIPYVGVKRIITGQPLGKPAKSKRGIGAGPRGIYQ